jgi:esterase/lipase superfamily enzyme
LKQFLRLLLSCEEVERVHLVAHSRGTDVLTTALRELVLEERGRTGGSLARLGVVANLVLAAPDLDVQVVGQRVAAEHLNTAVGRFTIYVCQEDRAINLSNWLFEGVRRLGVLSPGDLTKKQLRSVAKAENTHVIDVQGGAGFLSHGYFYENPAASSDLLLLLREDCDPAVGGVRPLEPLIEQFWVLEEDYPAGGGAVADR